MESNLNVKESQIFGCKKSEKFLFNLENNFKKKKKAKVNNKENYEMHFKSKYLNSLKSQKTKENNNAKINNEIISNFIKYKDATKQEDTNFIKRRKSTTIKINSKYDKC